MKLRGGLPTPWDSKMLNFHLNKRKKIAITPYEPLLTNPRPLGKTQFHVCMLLLCSTWRKIFGLRRPQSIKSGQRQSDRPFVRLNHQWLLLSLLNPPPYSKVNQLIISSDILLHRSIPNNLSKIISVQTYNTSYTQYILLSFLNTYSSKFIKSISASEVFLLLSFSVI